MTVDRGRKSVAREARSTRGTIEERLAALAERKLGALEEAPPIGAERPRGLSCPWGCRGDRAARTLDGRGLFCFDCRTWSLSPRSSSAASSSSAALGVLGAEDPRDNQVGDRRERETKDPARPEPANQKQSRFPVD